jgi:hypothetical protein
MIKYFIKDTLSDCITASLLCYALNDSNPSFELCSFYTFDDAHAKFWREEESKYNKVFFIGFDVCEKTWLDHEKYVFVCKPLYKQPNFVKAKVFYNDNNPQWVIDSFSAKRKFNSEHKELVKFAKAVDEFRSFSEEGYKLFMLYNEKCKGNERFTNFFKNYGYPGWSGFTKEDEIFVKNKEQQIDDYLKNLPIFEYKSNVSINRHYISVVSQYYLDYVTIYLRECFPSVDAIFIHNPKTDAIYVRRGKNSITDVSIVTKAYLDGDGNNFAAKGKATPTWNTRFIPNFKQIN